ncbi:hypothetical protein AG0111_0g11327 [Alternaria gaisen]|uniref:Uncharacterized protein n=1 Tax=Alternaria gaisen TaxID=167740 RepID=A0ACB6F7W7_9PLEO|nr:hypothetical protein AG0111_0g11327 [Alternaria gaisen]
MSVWGNIRELHGRILTHSCTAITGLHCIIEHFGADRLAGHLNRSHASTLLASQTNQCAILQSNKVYDNDAMMSRPHRLI